MTRSYPGRRRSRSRDTQPIPVIRVVARRRDPSIQALGFTCFRLVPGEVGLVPLELVRSTSRMFAFVNQA